MKRMINRLNTIFEIGLLILLAFLVTSCEKESPIIIEDSEPVSDVDGNICNTIKIGEQVWMAENLNVSHFMNEDLIREAKVPEEWGPAGIEYEPAWSYKNNDSENREKTGKQDNWDVAYDPIGFDVFLFAHFVIAGALLIISGIMTYNFIRDNHFNNLRYEKKN
jgi:hypothetical protein